MSRTVSVAGWGVVSAAGEGRADFAEAMATGRSAIGEAVSFDPEGLGFEKAAEMEEFDAKPYLRSPKNFLDRNSQLAFAACELAVRDAGIELPAEDKGAFGLSFGSGAGNLATMAMFYGIMKEKGPKLVPPFVFPHTYPNTTPSLLSIEYGLGGPHHVFNTGGVAGAQAVLAAMTALRQGRCRLALAGGAEAFSEPVCRGSRAAGWISPNGEGAEGCRPFAADRNGAVWGEGAAMFALTREDDAARAKLLGGGEAPSAEVAMRRALNDAGVGPGDIRLLVAAAGGYTAVDKEEADAALAVFGQGGVSVMAPKALLGETLGASGPLNLAVGLCALERGAPEWGAEGGIAFDWLTSSAAGAPVSTVMVNAAHPDGGAWVSLVLGAGA